MYEKSKHTIHLLMDQYNWCLSVCDICIVLSYNTDIDSRAND